MKIGLITLAKKLWQVSEEEERLFELARDGNVDAFTNYYLRGPNTGTWWFPGAKTPKWARGYARLHKYWLIHDRPDRFDYEDKVYQSIKKHEATDDYPDHPAFFQNHGFILLDFAKNLFRDRTNVRTIVGGWGSGKTMNMAVIYLVYAAIYPEFRGFSLAPRAKQANEFLNIVWNIMQGTRYMERFYQHYTSGPNAILRIGNSSVGETRIESFPLLGQESDILTLTGDCGVIDQAERFDILSDAVKSVGSRFRGRVISSGRERIGTLTLLANSNFNDELFEIYDRAEEDPENYFSQTLSSYDNPYLTDRDIGRYELLAEDEEGKRIHLLGGRSLGDGSVFSRDVMKRMLAPELDEKMQFGIDSKIVGYSYMEAKNVGVHEWLLPFSEERKYMVMSDPGTDNPPKRNSFAIMVWDYTDFPFGPATLAGFVWGFGRGDILNWANKHAELTWRYHAIGSNGFDGTAYQSGYTDWMAILNNLLSEKVDLGGNKKSDALNSARMVSAAGKMKIPVALTSIWSQLQRYEYPEPVKLKQDLVVTYVMSCHWLKRIWWFGPQEGLGEPIPVSEGMEDRYERLQDDRLSGRFD